MTQTNETLDRFLAEEVMGLHIGTAIARFSKEAIDCYKDKNDKAVMLIQGWHPSTNIEQALMCAENSKIQFELFTGWGGWHGSFRKFHEKSQNVRKWDFGHVKLEQLPRAICLALYEAYCVSLVGNRELTEKEQEYAMKIDLKPYEKYMKGGEHDTE